MATVTLGIFGLSCDGHAESVVWPKMESICSPGGNTFGRPSSSTSVSGMSTSQWGVSTDCTTCGTACAAADQLSTAAAAATIGTDDDVVDRFVVFMILLPGDGSSRLFAKSTTTR